MRITWRLGAFVGLWALSLSSACNGESAAPKGCAEGATTSCACPDGQTGTQTCGPDGRYGDCACPEPTPSPAPAAEPAEVAPEPDAPQAAVAVDAGAAENAPPPTLTPDPGTYEVTITREGQCVPLAGPVRALPSTQKVVRWRIKVSGPNTLSIEEGGATRRATLINGEYVLDRPSELGRALWRLRFDADGLVGVGSASNVSHRGNNRRTAEDCTETLRLVGHKR